MNPPQRRYPLESWALLYPPESRPPVVAPVSGRNWSWLTWAAWGLIVVLVVTVVLLQGLRGGRGGGPDQKEEASSVLTQMQARYLIGIPEFLRSEGSDQALEQLKPLKAGTAEDQLRYVIYAGELVGPKKALQELEELEYRRKKFELQLDRGQLRLQLGKEEHTLSLEKKKLDLQMDGKELQVRLNGEKRRYVLAEKVAFRPEDRQLFDILSRLYADYEQLRLDAPSVSGSERTLLRDRLGWAGNLALAPGGTAVAAEAEAGVGAPGAVSLAHASTPDPEERAAVLAPATRTFWSFLSTVTFLIGLGGLGLIGLLVCLFLYLSGIIHSRLYMKLGNGGVYAETFALWMLLFLVIGFGAPLLLARALPPLAASALAMFLSLLALVWPVLRGIPWGTVRRELGLTVGQHPEREVALGPACYAMSLPILVIGLMLTLMLMSLQRSLSGGEPVEPGSGPTHPIVYYLAQSDWWQRLQALFLASVAAPIVEETMFRGVLYRHLREVTGRFGFVLSVLASALFVSFLFAVIHPQGFLAVPALMALALGFSVMREWRGTLLPSMIAHGINNGILMLLMFLVLGNG